MKIITIEYKIQVPVDIEDKDLIQVIERFSPSGIALNNAMPIRLGDIAVHRTIKVRNSD